MRYVSFTKVSKPKTLPLPLSGEGLKKIWHKNPRMEGITTQHSEFLYERNFLSQFNICFAAILNLWTFVFQMSLLILIVDLIDKFIASLIMAVTYISLSYCMKWRLIQVFIMTCDITRNARLSYFDMCYLLTGWSYIRHWHTHQ